MSETTDATGASGTGEPGQAGGTSPSPATGSAHLAEAALYASMRRRLIIVTLAAGAASCLLGFLLRGLPGLYAGLIATGAGVAFMATTVILTAMAARRSPQLMLAAMLGGWLGKMVLAFIVIVIIRPLTFYDKATLVLALAAVVLAGLAAEALTVMRSREAYSLDVR